MVAAHLLKEQHPDVVGVHFVTGYEDADSDVLGQGVPRSLTRAAEELGIPVKVIGVQAEFKSLVVEPYVATYLKGQTPNPCMVCNRTIKFGALLHAAQKQAGARQIATGHYACVKKDSRGRFSLCKGVDPVKDQSYFLGFLTQEQLSRAVFPLSRFTKEQVRQKAKDLGLNIYTKPESQETCFIADDRYREFLQSQPGFQPMPGDIVDVHGTAIGRHQGVFAFTIGQRRGINIPACEAYYVKDIDPAANRIIVGFKKDLLSGSLNVYGINWITPPEQDQIRARTRIRYRHREAESTIRITGNNTATVVFDVPQSAVTPGQGAVFYHGDEVLGAGWIGKAPVD